MSNYTKLIVNGEEVDVYRREDLTVRIYKQYFSADDITKRVGDYTLNLKLPLTARNRQVFGFLFDAKNDRSFYDLLRLSASIVCNNDTLLSGTMYVGRVRKDEIEASIVGENIDWSNLLSDRSLRDTAPQNRVLYSGHRGSAFLPWPSNLADTVSLWDVWQTTEADGAEFCMPLLSWGNFESDRADASPINAARTIRESAGLVDGAILDNTGVNPLFVTDFRPASFVKSLMRNIFAQAGLTLKGSFVDSPDFDDYCVPATAGEDWQAWNWELLGRLDAEYVYDTDRDFRIDIFTSQDTNPSTADPRWRYDGVNEVAYFLLDYPLASSVTENENYARVNNLSNPDLSTYRRFVAQADGTYDVEFELTISAKNIDPTTLPPFNSTYSISIDDRVFGAFLAKNVRTVDLEGLAHFDNPLTADPTFVVDSTDLVYGVVSFKCASANPTNTSIPDTKTTPITITVSATVDMLANDYLVPVLFFQGYPQSYLLPPGTEGFGLGFTIESGSNTVRFSKRGDRHINPYGFLPEMTQLEFVTGVITAFNLFLYQAGSVVTLDTRELYFMSNDFAADYTDLTDASSVVLSTPKGFRTIEFDYSVDDGEMLFDSGAYDYTRTSDSSYWTDSKVIQLPFAATGLRKYVVPTLSLPVREQFSLDIPTFATVDEYRIRLSDLYDASESVNYSREPRLLRYKGVYSVPGASGVRPIFVEDVAIFDSGPFSGSFPYARCVFIDDTAPFSLSFAGEDGLFNTFYARQIESYERSVIAEASVMLSASDVAQLDVRRPVVLDGVTYRLVSLDGYDPIVEKPTKITLLKQ